MGRYSLLLVWILFAGGANAQVAEFGWLIGTWQEKEKSNFEVWRANGDQLSAESFELKSDGSKNVTETVLFIKRGDSFFYVPDVPHNQKPVEFKITSHDANGFVAENPEHDFPKKITYQLISKELLATISDGNKRISYSFTKIK